LKDLFGKKTLGDDDEDEEEEDEDDNDQTYKNFLRKNNTT
jgi:hypothetical protein